jgi:hypothetical protein
MAPISAQKMINFAYSYSFISSAIVKHVIKGIMNLNIHSLQGVWGAGLLHLLLKSVRDLMYTKQKTSGDCFLVYLEVYKRLTFLNALCCFFF